MYNEYIKKYSPFSNDSPAPFDSFIGRKDIIEKILKQTPKLKEDKPQNYFISSKKGFGKTSLVLYIEELLYNKMHTIYISNKGNDSLEDLCVDIIETFLNIFPQKISEKIKANLFGQKIEINDLARFTEDIVKYFPSYLEYICKYLPKNVLLICDDMDDLINNTSFVNWYINLINEINLNNYKIPIYFILTSLKLNFDAADESFKNLFNYYNLGFLEDEDVEEFFELSFDSVDMSLDNGEWDDALSYLISYSSGIPWLMQEIGENIFQHAHYPEKITQRDINEGLIDTSETVYYKEIRDIYIEYFKDPVFDRIFKKILPIISLDGFMRDDFSKYLVGDELIFLDEYLLKALNLEILVLDNGVYSFVNRFYSIYFSNI